MRGILLEAAVQDNDEHRRQVIAHQIRSESDRAIRAALSLAKSDATIATRPDDFDRDPMLFNVINGTIDLRTCELRPHSREDLLTKLAPVHFDPLAKCPTWERFLAEVLPSPWLIPYAQRAVGYSLTGDTSEECIFLLFGTGANGKSKFLEALRLVIGDYSLATDADTYLMRKGQAVRNDIARLRGSRFVTASESEAGRRFAESMLKNCTGGDTVAARFLYSEHFEFVPTFKLWLATNHKPRISGNDESIWRRIRLIPFSVTIPPEHRDHKLAEKLKNEAPGILNWCLDGVRDWQAQGLGCASAVEQATADYRTDQDVISHFVAARVAADPAGEARARDLYVAYRLWCDDAGEIPMNERDFGSALANHGFTKRRIGARENKPAGVYWSGVSLTV